MVFKRIELNPIKNVEENIVQKSQIYKGFSTVTGALETTKIYDFDLIKQDLLNQFNIRKGELVMNPEFGTIIWGLLYEPFTDDVKTQITSDVNRILNSDPRVVPTNIDIIESDYGFLMDVTLTSVETNQVDNLKITFDKSVGITT